MHDGIGWPPTDGGESSVFVCGNSDPWDPGESHGWVVRPSVNKERGHEEHSRGEVDFNRLMFPTQTGCCAVRRSLDVGQDDRARLPSVGSVKMGTLGLRCVYRAHGRSHREKPV